MSKRDEKRDRFWMELLGDGVAQEQMMADISAAVTACSEPVAAIEAGIIRGLGVPARLLDDAPGSNYASALARQEEKP